MREEGLSHEVRYGKKDIAELESASIQVQLIYKKVAQLFKRTAYSRSVHHNFAEVDEALMKRASPSSSPAVFQKWIQASSGWKCIGCELGQPEVRRHLEIAEGRKVQAEMLIQAIVWSQYEKIRMLAPWLEEELFYTTQELDVIARYIVPTYFSERPLHEQGKSLKVHQPNGHIPLFQEYVAAPSCCVQIDGERFEGLLLTGVYVSDEQFYGLNPYLKDGDGGRTYVQACIQ